jgi:hypothetical protein
MYVGVFKTRSKVRDIVSRKTGKIWTVLEKIIAVIIAVLLAIACYTWIWIPYRPADISHVRISKIGLRKFSNKQINEAINAVLDTKRDFRNCTIDAVTYDESDSNDMLKFEKTTIEDYPGSGSGIYSNGIAVYGMDDMVVIQTDYTCGSNAPDQGLEPGKTTGWTDYLAYDPKNSQADHGWLYIDGGFG